MSNKVEFTAEQLEELKSRLDLLNIKYPASAKGETLVELLKKEESENPTAKTPYEEHQEVNEKALEPVRCIIHNFNPAKKALKGEFFSTGNSITGTIRVFVPYNCEASENGYTLPRMIVEALKLRTYMKSETLDKVEHGEMQRTMRVPEFKIIEIPFED